MLGLCCPGRSFKNTTALCLCSLATLISGYFSLWCPWHVCCVITFGNSKLLLIILKRRSLSHFVHTALSACIDLRATITSKRSKSTISLITDLAWIDSAVQSTRCAKSNDSSNQEALRLLKTSLISRGSSECMTQRSKNLLARLYSPLI